MTQPLQSVPFEVKESLAALEKGGYVSQLLQNPPISGKKWDEWRLKMTSVLEKADAKLLSAVLPGLFEQAVATRLKYAQLGNGRRNGLTASEIRYFGYKDIFFVALKRWGEEIDNTFHDLPAKNHIVLKTFLLESCLRIPVFSIHELRGTFDLETAKKQIAVLEKEAKALRYERTEYEESEYTLRKNNPGYRTPDAEKAKLDAIDADIGQHNEDIKRIQQNIENNSSIAAQTAFVRDMPLLGALAGAFCPGSATNLPPASRVT